MGSNPTLRQTGRFVNGMKLENSRLFPERLERTVIISDDLLATRDEIWISDRAAAAAGIGQLISYVWSTYDARRVGLNLMWMQARCQLPEG